MKVIGLLTHEYPPLHGGVGVSSERISKILSAKYKTYVIHIINTDDYIIRPHTIEKLEENLYYIRLEVPSHSSSNENDSITAPDSSYNQTRFQQNIFIVLRNLCHNVHFDLFITLYLTNFGHISSAIAKEFNIKHIASIRGNDIGKNFFDSALFPHIKYILKNSDYIISVNSELNALANTIENIDHKSSVIFNSVTQSPSVERIPPLFDNDYITISTIGIFRYKKGLLYLLEALSLINKDFNLLLIGDYKNESEQKIHENIIKKHQLEDRVKLTGMTNHSERFSYLNLSDIVVIPSLFSEGCPSTLLEALTLSKPIIVSDAGSNKEIVTHGINGLIYKQTDYIKLAEFISQLIDDKELRDALSIEAKELAKTLNHKKEGDSWYRIIDKLIL